MGGLHLVLPVYCMQARLVWGGTGCVMDCRRMTLHFDLSVPRDSQRRTFITTLPPEGRQSLLEMRLWRDPAWRKALGRGCLQDECDVAKW